MKKSTIILSLTLIGVLQITANAQNLDQVNSKGYDVFLGYNPFFHDAHTLHGIEVKLQRRTGKWVYGVEGNYYMNGLIDGLDNYKNLNESNFHLQGLKINNFKHYGITIGRNIAMLSNIDIGTNLMMGLIDFSATFYEYEYVETGPNETPVYFLFMHIFPREISWILRPTLSTSFGINRFADLEVNLGYNIVSDEIEGKTYIRGLVNAIGFRIQI